MENDLKSRATPQAAPDLQGDGAAEGTGWAETATTPSRPKSVFARALGKRLLWAVLGLDEWKLLQEFEAAWAQVRKIDHVILDLAVQNTNLKAFRLSFGKGREAPDFVFVWDFVIRYSNFAQSRFPRIDRTSSGPPREA